MTPENLFNGWGLMIWAVPGWALLNALLALPALVFKNDRAREMTATRTVLGVAAAGWATVTFAVYASEMSVFAALLALPTSLVDAVIFVAIPQWGALVLSQQRNRARRPLLAAMLTVFGYVIYAGLGVISGASID